MSLRARLSDLRLRRRLRKVPAVQIADAPENAQVRLVGHVRPLAGRVLEAPLSGRRCVYYAVEVIERQAVFGRARSGPLLAMEQDAIAFVLEDGSARAVVDPAHALVSAGTDRAQRSVAAFDATPPQRELLGRHGLIRRDWWGTVGLSYREAILELGELVTVVGAGTRVHDPEARPTGAYRDGPELRLQLTGTARFPLTISDDPRR